MPFVEWEMQGIEVVNCNCDWGCPCQFNRPPTHKHCRAYGVVQIDKGYFGDVRLDGLRWAMRAAWPGPIHLGNGSLQVIVDERANAAQRAAIEAVGQGRETEPGAVVWQVFATTVSEMLPTLVAPIEMRVDMDQRQAQVRVGTIVEGRVTPILNPVTGKPHQVRVNLPAGFEYTEAEYASGTAVSTGEIPLQFDATHAHLARVHWSTHGVVR